MGIHLGLVLPPRGIPDAVCAAESAEVDAVWAGEHLVIGSPRTYSAVALAAATTATSIAIGWWVLLPALRPLAWAFKVVTSLQHESGGRVSSASESVGASEDRMPQTSGRQQNNPLGAAWHAPTGSPTLLPHALA